MSRAAVLLMDLQKDFLDCAAGRMPVDPLGAEAVIHAANAVLAKRVLADALPICVLNQFPVEARVGNFFRKGAAVAGRPGAALDARILGADTALTLHKARASAFSNPQLVAHLRAHEVTELYVLGVFAEGCVRATVNEAIRLGFSVRVWADAVASNAGWKKRFALWSMARAGARIQSACIA